MASNAGAKLCGGCFCLTFIISVILFSVSFDTLEPHVVGVKYNNNLVTIDEETVYNNGRHFVGLGLEFIEFPVNLVEIAFLDSKALRAWSKEGQNLAIDVNFYYRLQRDSVIKLYRRYGVNYHERFTTIARSVIKKVTVLYEATQFFESRQEISSHIMKALKARFAGEFCTIEHFNLRKIAVPNKFDQKIIDKVVKAQEYQTALNIAKTAVKRAEVEVIRLEGDAQVDLKLATAQANAAREISQARSDAALSITKQEASSYARLASELGFDAIDSARYRYAQTLQTFEEKNVNLKFVLGFEGTALVNP